MLQTQHLSATLPAYCHTKKHHTSLYRTQLDVAREAEADVIRRVQELDREEPLLQENPRRFVMFPIRDHDIWHFYKKAEGELGRQLERTIRHGIAFYGGSPPPGRAPDSC